MRPSPLLSNQQRRRSSVWVLVLFVWGLLSPGLSVALAAAQGDYGLFQEVCRTSASAARAGSEQAPGGDALAMLTAGHCASCHSTLPDLAPPPPAAAIVLAGGLSEAAPALFWQAPHTLFAWRHAPARAPPTQH
jgi:Protein of unknown function (DUF2946)